VKKIIELLEEIIALSHGKNVKEKRWLTPEELEMEYNLKEDTISKYRMAKKIPFIKVGSKLIRYDRIKIDKWLEDHEVVGFDDAS